MDTVESVFIYVKGFPLSQNCTTIFGVIYHPPNLPISPFIEKVDLLTSVKEHNAKVHLSDDLKIDLLTYPNNKKASDLINAIISSIVLYL